MHVFNLLAGYIIKCVWDGDADLFIYLLIAITLQGFNANVHIMYKQVPI